MTDQKTYDPFTVFKKFSDQWEKQMNDSIHLWTNTRDFVRFSRMSSDMHARYLEVFKKNQELWANQLNLPTKTDLANVAKLSLQTEEKLDSLEEQMWKLQDSVDLSNKEIENIVEISRDIIKLTKQLKTENTKVKQELAETKELRTEIQELKSELAEINNLKEELTLLKGLVNGESAQQTEQEETQEEYVQKELELAGVHSE